MVVHRHDLRPTLARLCRLLTKSPALQTEARPVTQALTPAPVAEMAPAAPSA
jgi:acetyl-CoA carboxylase carboxyl transferase subunit beta